MKSMAKDNTSSIQRISIHKVFQNRAFLSAILFVLFLYALEETFLSPRHIIYLWILRSYHAPILYRLQGFTEIIFSFLIVFLFLWLSFSSQIRVRIVYFLILSSATLVQYNYWNTLHRFITATDLNTARNSPPDLWLDSAALFFDPFAFIPITIYLLLFLWTKQSKRYGFKSFLLLSLFIVGANVTIYYVGQKDTPAPAIQSMFKTLTSAAFTESVVYLREEVPFQSDNAPQNNIVLIIDESVRGDRLGINGYHRPTTPYLEELAVKGKVHNWGTAVSSATCSMSSNIVIVAGLSTLPDDEKRADQNATIFQYAKAMGYQTYYFDAQTKYLWTGLRVDDLQYIDHWVNVKTLGEDLDADFRAADAVAEVIQQNTGNFIVINKKGVHFHYNDVYPPEQAIWTPIPSRKAYDDLAMVSNTYDNAIFYNVDTFFRRLIPKPQAVEQTIFLYTSDHGQTLIENGASWSHCGETKNEALVPLLLIGDFDNRLDVEYRASHYNIFATLLDLMDVPSEARIRDYPSSLFLMKASDSADRYYLGGNGQSINFDRPDEAP
ncbi:MAG: sulfatase-like hydrolase/transferase [Chloroflexi bacterium]|nr:sulfatase-like hydrolase/transferase [Chloroflexota bacterium]